jgi:DNA-binding FrmR family transcriptional regulator
VKSEYKDKKVAAQKRLNIIKGQVNGLDRMIEDDEYCIDILNQSLAIQNALRGLDAVLFERHLITHVDNQFKSGDKKVVPELVALFKRVNQ